MKHGKKYTEAAKLVDRATFYEPNDAIALVKKTATAKFDETIEVHIRTGCDQFRRSSENVTDKGNTISWEGHTPANTT